MGILSIMFGCEENPNPPHTTGDPESIYVYGFLEECSDGTNTFSIKSVEISSSYSANNTKFANSGYYVIIGVDTNLSEGDLSNLNNTAELGLAGDKFVKLKFLACEFENKKLIYEIPHIENVDYEKLCDLQISTENAEFPFLSVSLDYFNRYCTIDGIQYAGRCFVLRLK